MFNRIISFVAAFTVVIAVGVGSSFGQDLFGDPFGGAGEALPDDSGSSATSKKAQPTDNFETDAVVLAIRNSKPTTPEQLGTAIRNVIYLGKSNEAKKYIKQLLDSSPDATTLVELHRQLGSGMFMRMARDESLAPEGQTLGKSVLEAAYAAAHDPTRINDLITRLSDEDLATRHAALVDLRSAGTDAVVALIGVLSDSSRQAEHAAVRRALVDLKHVAVGPLVGAMQSQDESLVPQVIVVLSRLSAGQITPHLLRPYFTSDPNSLMHEASAYALKRMLSGVPERRDAEQYLEREAQAYFDGKLVARPDYEDMVTLWSWDSQAKSPVEQRFKSDTASLMMASRLANDLFAMAPDNIDYRRLALTSALESAKRTNGLDQPLPTDDGTVAAVVSSLGVEAIEDTLEYALEADKSAAATGAIELLGDIGTTALLASRGGLPSPLAGCLRHPDRRVRFAAVNAIMKLDPAEPFAGASYLAEALSYFASNVGSRRVLVAHPRTDQAQTLVGLLNGVGFEADTAQTGRETLRLSVAYPDYEFMLISDAVDNPPVSELIQQLRRDPRTSTLPIGLMAREDRFELMESVTASDPLTETFPRPHDTVGLSVASRRLLERAGDDLATYDERMMHAETAIDHLAKLAEDSKRYGFYDLLRIESSIEQAANTPALANKATHVLGLFGTPTAQRLLVSLASQNARQLSQREAAAQAFETAVARRGLLLARNEILLQYDRYNQSKTLSRETQAVLASLLDSIEKPTLQSSAEGDESAADSE